MSTVGLLVTLFGLSLSNLDKFGYKEERVLSFGDEVASQATDYMKSILSGKWLDPRTTSNMQEMFMKRTSLLSFFVYLLLLFLFQDQVGQLCDYLSANYQRVSHHYLLALAASVLLYALFLMKVRCLLLEKVFLRLSQVLVLPICLMFIVIFYLPISAVGFVILSLTLCTAYSAKALGGIGLLGFFLSALGLVL